jgi:pimeloyl-[acyl-carrier protein] methyl ester esterase
MAPEVFAGFSASLTRDAAATLRRFLLLQAQGDAQSRTVARQLEAALALQPEPRSSVLMETLHWLQTTDLRATLPEIVQPTLVVHGDCDRIAPPAAGEYLAAHLPQARLALLAGAAHAPFISDPDAVGRLMTEFCNE